MNCVDFKPFLTYDNPKPETVLVQGWVCHCMRKRLPFLTYIQTRNILTSGSGSLIIYYTEATYSKSAVLGLWDQADSYILQSRAQNCDGSEYTHIRFRIV